MLVKTRTMYGEKYVLQDAARLSEVKVRAEIPAILRPGIFARVITSGLGALATSPSHVGLFITFITLDYYLGRNYQNLKLCFDSTLWL